MLFSDGHFNVMKRFECDSEAESNAIRRPDPLQTWTPFRFTQGGMITAEIPD